jgi:hypothetical protein
MTPDTDMISKSWPAVLWAAIVLFLFSAIPAAAVSKGKINSYSADLVMIAPDGK